MLATLRAVGRRPVPWIVFLALLGFGGSLSVGLVRGLPLPFVHDEFSYLLASDTFAEGRLTNPTHPHWEHFESFHIIHQPTYQSKYPPGQGLILAAGQVVTGHPIVGVWISVGLMAAAVGWALLLWLPPAWAVLAGLMYTMQLAWFSYWAQSYWGGAVAALGGALALGAFRGLLDRNRWTYGALFGGGLGIMALSRPFEGAVLGGVLCTALVADRARTPRFIKRAFLLRAVAPAALVLVPILGGMAYYNSQVTGSALTLPYQVHEAEYAASPPFLFQAPVTPPTYRHEAMERFWMSWGKERHERLRSFSAIGSHVWQNVRDQLSTILGAAVLALLGWSTIITRNPSLGAVQTLRMRFGFFTIAAVLSVSLATTAANPHYVAPITALLFVAVGGGLMAFHRSARHRRRWNLVPLIVMVFLVITGLNGARMILSPPRGFPVERSQIAATIQDVPGKHLVLVSYGAAHNPHQEWVYNRADIDGAQIVWARAINQEKDRRLQEYFSDRSIWCLEVDGEARLTRLAAARHAAPTCFPGPVEAP